MQIILSKYKMEILSEITGLNFDFKTNSNQKIINSILDIGKINAENYLNRKKLGQRLDIFEENNLFNTLVTLKEKLNLSKIPRRIECFDISHLSGQFVYGSMVVFIDGIAKNSLYRVFKCPNENDDFGSHKLVLTRRIHKYLEYQNQQKFLVEELENLQKDEFDDAKVNIRTQEIARIKKLIEQNKINLQNWNLPDLIIVDGGKGQLSVDFEVLCEFGLQSTIDIISLAKREEEIFTIDLLSNLTKNTNNYQFDSELSQKNLKKEKTEQKPPKLQNENWQNNEKIENLNSENINIQNEYQNQDYIPKEVLNDKKPSNQFGSQGGILLTDSPKYLVQRIRDEAHRFAIKHNRNARLKNLKNSDIDKIIGPKTKMKLLTKFGSLTNLAFNLEQNLELVSEIIGLKIIQKLQKYFQNS